ncbi:Hpt domain-containing protein [Roseovarius phycicola]|uniref:Hpt domain-containing protein n=1 Tax=Roseovarius phycicola TaxID=3080976 RepID=A0ABZ2HJN2_9RHOB
MIDWTRVAQLRDEIGAEDFEEILDIFLEEVDAEIANLYSGCSASQLETLLHFLKGSALNLGFEAFSKLCQEGELQLAKGSRADLDLDAISDSYANSKTLFLDQLEYRL